MKGYHHLTYNDRLIIERLILHKKRIADIAEAIGCRRGAIYYELRRKNVLYLHTNSNLTQELRYNPDMAHRQYRQHLKTKGVKAKLEIDEEQNRYLESLILHKKYSPRAALYHIKEERLVFALPVQSVNTIYRCIETGIFEHLKIEMLPHQRRRRTKNRQIQKRKSAGISIEKRPKHIDKREEVGHWEMDCVVGEKKNRKTLLVFTERKTKKEIIEILNRHSAEEVVKALDRLELRFGHNFFRIFKTITVDNGSEFSYTKEMERSALFPGIKRTEFYYCHAFCSCERGTNEVNNKLIRRWLPKGSDFDKLLNYEFVKMIEAWMNHYPRHVFGGDCAENIYKREFKTLNIDSS